MLFRKLHVLLVVCAVAVLSGCASFKNNEVAAVGKLPDVSHYKNKPSVFVDSHFYRGEPGAVIMEVHNKADVDGMIGPSLGDMGLFSKYSFDAADKAAADYTLAVDIYNHGANKAAAAAGALTGFTLGVIPSWATDNYTVEVKLLDKSGAVVSKVSNKDSIRTYIGLWFVPMMGATPKKAAFGTLDNQIRTLLKELVDSGKLKYSLSVPMTRESGAA
jgi:hypothetical protein